MSSLARRAAGTALVCQLLTTGSALALSADFRPPQIAGISRASNSFDVVWQNQNPDDGKIQQTHVEKQGQSYVITRTDSLASHGLLAGFAVDSSGNFYHMSAEPSTFGDPAPKQVELYKNNISYWNLQTQDDSEACKAPTTPMLLGSSRIVTGDGKLFLDANIGTAHTYNVLLNLDDGPGGNTRCARHRLWQHNFGQRALFDGSDFVTLENRDHELTLTMAKYGVSESYPWANLGERARSVYARTGHGNSTFTDLGGLELGLDDSEGYLVLFTTERDRDYFMQGLNDPGQGYSVSGEVSPRDVAVIHVRRDFDQQPANWRDPGGTWFSQAPKLVDTTAMVNSLGEGKTVTYRTADDGWDWPSYSPDTAAELSSNSITERQYTTAGVNWLTGSGESYANAARLPDIDEEFTTAYHSKLGKLSTNEYVAIWEEHSGRRRVVDMDNGQKLHFVERDYRTTKAMSISLQRENGQVRIQRGIAKDLGSVRLTPNDDPFTLDGKVAFLSYRDNGTALVLNTIDPSMSFQSQDLTEGTATPAVTLAQVMGTYLHTPFENSWHRGRIFLRGPQLVWENEAPYSWNLSPDLQNGALHTDTTNPYFDPAAPATQDFRLHIVNGQVQGFTFNSTTFDRISD